MKYLAPLLFAAAMATAPGVSFAQVEVRPGGVTIGPHHDNDTSHGQSHDVPVVQGHDNDHSQNHGDAHGGAAIRIEGAHVDGGQGGHTDDRSNDQHHDRR